MSNIRPVAKVPICWVCDKRLVSRRTYKVFRDENGHDRVSHIECDPAPLFNVRPKDYQDPEDNAA
jgi:hypothetical protein